jgi:hypothetical protein
MTREESREYWLPRMKEGRFRFVLKNGIFRFGAPASLGSFAIAPNSFARAITIYMAMTIVLGSIGGLLLWHINRWRFALK